jgi:hypothetical protein
MPTPETGFLNRMMDTTTATAPFALPSTCSVSGLVHLVTKKLVRFTLKANTQLSATVKKNLGESTQFW